MPRTGGTSLKALLSASDPDVYVHGGQHGPLRHVHGIEKQHGPMKIWATSRGFTAWRRSIHEYARQHGDPDDLTSLGLFEPWDALTEDVERMIDYYVTRDLRVTLLHATYLAWREHYVYPADHVVPCKALPLLDPRT
jgi:hypothetical protein